MRAFFKLSLAVVTIGAFALMPGGANAMRIMGAGGEAPPPDQVHLDISGFGGAMTSLLTPLESSSGEVAPSTFVTAVEARLNVDVGTDTMMLHMARWIRQTNGDFNYSGWDGFGLGRTSTPYEMAELVWHPMPELRVQAGSLIYGPWADRAVLWENFSVVGPLHPGWAYTGYIENSPGVDLGYKIGDMEVGAGLFTYAAITGAMTNLQGANKATDPSPAAAPAAVSAQTIVPHFVYVGGPLQLRVSYFLESVTTSADGWVTDDGGLSNTLAVVDVKFQYDDAGSFAKADYLMADGDSYGTANNIISATVSQMLGADAVWVSFSSNTAAGGADGVDQSWVMVGYKHPVSAGADVRVEYHTLDDSVSSGNSINFVLFQSY
jgi:hypothetical protein